MSYKLPAKYKGPFSNQSELEADSFIAEQWDLNALTRLDELEGGKDKTYRKTICPVLYDLLVKNTRGKSILDVGCGLGFFSNYITNHGFDCVGIDVSTKSISLAKERFPEVSFHERSIVDFQDDSESEFDACIANMMFHNVPNLGESLSVIFDLLKPDGVLIGSLPHPELWFNRRRDNATKIQIFDEPAFLTSFKIKGCAVHPAPLVYFNRRSEDYWKMFRKSGFLSIQVFSYQNIPSLPDDLIFFVAKKSNDRNFYSLQESMKAAKS